MRSEIIKQREAAILDRNWDHDHTRPSIPHYDHKWLWDSVFASIINNKRGLPDRAATEIKSLFGGQDPKTGFIPNMNYMTGHNWRDIEALTFRRPDIGSSYTQPPIIAAGAWETYETYKKQGKKEEGLRFLREIFGEVSPDGEATGLQGFYNYFTKYRENGNGSKLLGNVHPHETGRDSDPSLRPDLPFIQGRGKLTGLINGAIDYGTILKLNVQLKMHDLYPEKGRPTVHDIVDFKGRKEKKQQRKEGRYDWDPEKVREVYWINDVMFNCLYVDNLEYMSQISQELGEQAKADGYRELASKVKKEISEKMWNEQDGTFYNLDKNGKQIKVTSITSLSPLLLDTLSEHQVTKLVDQMEDPRKFNTYYVLPSVPADSKYFNPSYEEPRLWKKGEIWPNANYIINKGLLKQLERDDLSPELHQRIISRHENLVKKTKTLIEEDLLTTGTTHELYNTNPVIENGRMTVKGYRIKDFTWSLIGLHLDERETL